MHILHTKYVLYLSIVLLMKLSSTNSLFKLLFSFFVGVTAFVFFANAGVINIPSSIDNALQVIKRILITDDGTQSGATVMDINTGGSVVVYGPLLDAWLHAYITWAVLTESDPIYLASVAALLTTWMISNRDTAHSRGNHATMWYLTAESDPMFFGSAASHVTTSDMVNWDEAHGRGNHAIQWYLTTETDPIWSGDKHNYYTTAEIDYMISTIAGALVYKWGRDYSTGALPSDVSKWDLYLITNLIPGNFNGWDIESPDQIVAKHAVVGVTTTGDWDLIENDWNEVDPVFLASDSFHITNSQILNWDTAFGRGNHATMWYLTWYDESDPIWEIAKNDYYTKTTIDTNYYTKNWIDTHTVGATGATGPQGDVWPQGIQWVAWVKWTTWATGPQGDVWPQGPAGADGAQWIQWSTGPQWATGAQWATWTFDGTETDPVYAASAAANVTNIKISHWDTTYGRGNNAIQWYLTGETDPVRNLDKSSYYNKTEVDSKIGATVGMSYRGVWNYSTGLLPTSPLTWYFYVTNIAGDFSGMTLHTWDMFIANKAKVWATNTGDWDLIDLATSESDPIYLASVAYNITNPLILNRNTAYGRGNHATMWYLTGWSLSAYATTSSLSSYVLLSQTGNWNTSYGRGNHATMWYLTGGSFSNYYTKSEVDSLLTGTHFGGGSSYSYFEADGTLVFTGNAKVWKDINVGMIGGVWWSAPDLVTLNGTIMVECYDGNNTPEYAYASVEMEHDWKEWTAFHPHLHMMPSSNSAGTGRFTLSYSLIPTNGVATTAVTTTVDQYYPANSLWLVKMPEFPEISLTGYHIWDQIAFRISRDPTATADTFPNDICLNSIGFHYESDTMGSRLEYTK